jgi:DMSO/TMAO reductase YedYZ molybdopterin-dependent catalytic subunit
LTSVFGAVLLVLIPIVALTGLVSNAAYNPWLAGNNVGRHLGPLDVYLFTFPTRPVWLYAFTQGTHVTVSLLAMPLILAKLWSVIPKLFEWPPLRSPAHALERVTLALLVGSVLFEFVTGLMNIQYDYEFTFFFTPAHYYGAWVFIAAFIFHVSVKLPTMRASLRTRSMIRTLREDLDHTLPEVGPSELVSPNPTRPTMSRRTLFATIGVGSLLLALQGLGDSAGGPFRVLAFLGPRNRGVGSGPNGFQVNQTFFDVGLDTSQVGNSWRLVLQGDHHEVHLSRERLLAMAQHTCDLPIACVEGWSTTQRWTGVRVRDLARHVGIAGPAELTATSIEDSSLFYQASWTSLQVDDPDALLALKVNGVDLSLDHGYPARLIAPATPGVHCTKWVQTLQFVAI